MYEIISADIYHISREDSILCRAEMNRLWHGTITIYMAGSKTIQRGYKYRIYPTEAQIRQIVQTFGCVRYVYNSFLSLWKEAWERGRVHPTGPALRLIELLDKDQELALLLIEKDND